MKNIDIMNKYEDRNISENAKTVYEAISIFRKMGSSNMNIRGTMGNNKRNNLTKEIGMEILSLSRTDCKHIGVLKLGISKVEGDKVGNVEHIDLLGNKLCDKFYVKYSSDKLIKSSEILMKVIESYNNKYTYI